MTGMLLQDGQASRVAPRGPHPNLLLRRARLARCSPSGSGLPMSRQEVADEVNVYLHARGGSTLVASADYVGRLERGEIRWPRAAYRAAFHAVFGVDTDAELGFYITRAAPTLDNDLSEPAVHPEHIRDAQRDLGRQLAAARKAAEHRQTERARLYPKHDRRNRGRAWERGAAVLGTNRPEPRRWRSPTQVVRCTENR